MFFSNDLLAQRESGFGLLWLAATLGSRSTFKKLPRRSILSADISSLCSLIVEPEEPLSLRLSSNLMMGVTRVYVAKHDIFANDVTNCFTSLKKAVNEIRTAGTISDSLEMGASSVRPDLVTIATNGISFDFEFDFFEPFWGDSQALPRFGLESSQASIHTDNVPSSPFENIFADPTSSANDITFEPPTPDIQRRGLESTKKRPPFSIEKHGSQSQDPHILKETHLYDPISDFSFSAPDKMEWNDFLLPGDPNGLGLDGEIDLGIGADVFGDAGLNDGELFGNVELNLPDFHQDEPFGALDIHALNESPLAGHGKKRGLADLFEDQNLAEAQNPIFVDPETLSALPDEQGVDAKVRNKKKYKVIVDVRIELTDDELRAAREKYDEEQLKLGREIAAKKKDKEAYFRAMEMIWQPPEIFGAPELIQFWNDVYKEQVQARHGSETEFRSPEPPSKRRKVGDKAHATEALEEAHYALPMEIDNPFPENDGVVPGDALHDMDLQMEFAFGGNAESSADIDKRFRTESRHASRGASVDTPEIGRRAPSRPLSALEFGSQRNSFLPWDQGGAFSSDADNGFGMGFENVGDLELGGSGEDLKMKPASQEGDNDGSIKPNSRYASGSPAIKFGRQSSLDNFVLNDLDVQTSPKESQEESQQSETSRLATLERNSHNFLEYAKILISQNPAEPLTLSKIAPVASSTPHVAAAAFYHILVLATKDLIGIEQNEPYSDISITVL